MLRRLLSFLLPDDRDARIAVLEAENAELRRRVRACDMPRDRRGRCATIAFDPLRGVITSMREEEG